MSETNNLMFESLHNHTVISDGRQTHLETLDAAEAAGFGLISFTDHDILPRDENLTALENYDGPVKWNVGIEISSGLPHELGGGPATLFHILGLRIDHTNDDLRAYCHNAENARFTRLEQTVRNLQKIKFDIQIDECLELAGEGAPGTPHVSRALLNKENNVRRLQSIADDMRQKAQTNSELAQKYDAMMFKVRSGQRHPYVRDLLLSDTAYIPDVYVPYSFSLEMDKTVELIRSAGGLAIIAHWPSVRELINEQHLRSIVAEGRIDGLELRTIFNASPTIEDDMLFLGNLAKQYGLLTTVGVDSHGPEDFNKFAAIPGAADMTVGQWEKVASR